MNSFNLHNFPLIYPHYKLRHGDIIPCAHLVSRRIRIQALSGSGVCVFNYCSYFSCVPSLLPFLPLRAPFLNPYFCVPLSFPSSLRTYKFKLWRKVIYKQV